MAGYRSHGGPPASHRSHGGRERQIERVAGARAVHAPASSTCTPPTPSTIHDRPSPTSAVFSSRPTSREPSGTCDTMKSVSPGANPSNASQCGANRVRGNTPRPGCHTSSSSSVRSLSGTRSPRHDDAGAAARIDQPAVHLFAKGRPERRLAEDRCEVGGVAAGEVDHRRSGEPRDEVVSVRVITVLELQDLAVDTEATVVIEPLASPHVEHLVALGSRRRRRDRDPARRTRQDPSVDRLGPRIELARSEQGPPGIHGRTFGPARSGGLSSSSSASPRSAAISINASTSSASVR